MFQKWFTNKCRAIVGEDGYALTGSELELAKKDPHHKICGHLVKTRAKFCSKCGAAAPGSWWRCSACGNWIGVESQSCPHCGKKQDVAARLDISGGRWRKGDDVFAQRFDAQDIAPLLEKGLMIQEGQCAVLLDGGAVCDVLPPGHYGKDELADLQGYLHSGSAKSFVMVELSEIPFPVEVVGLRTKDDMTCSMTCVVVLQFDHEKATEFMCNLMGNQSYVTRTEVGARLGYADIAHFMISDVDNAAHDFCNAHNVDEIFREPKLRIDFENTVSAQLERNLSAAGLRFVRLKELEFRDGVFEKLREMSGDIEAKRREIEFRMRADELANDAAKREAKEQKEMEDYLDQLAHEKDIKDHDRAEEMALLGEKWEFDRAKAKFDMEKTEQERQGIFLLTEVQQAEQRKLAAQEGELKRKQNAHNEMIRQRLAEQRASLEYAQIQDAIEKLRIEREDFEEKLKNERKKDMTRFWVEILTQRKNQKLEREIKRAQAFNGLSSTAIGAAIEDPIRAGNVMKSAELESMKEMTPELLLAAAAARGVPEAARAYAGATDGQKAKLEQIVKDNQVLYEKMLAMNERMFNKAAESMAKGNAIPGSTTTIVK